MGIEQNYLSQQKVVSLLLLFWLAVTTADVAPLLNPPLWATGFFYGAWWLLVMWGLLIICATPSGIAMILGARLFGKSGMIIFGFLFFWVFDTAMKKNYPFLPLAPGIALSMLYVYLTLIKMGKIKP
jgi:hypothetical protein